MTLDSLLTLIPILVALVVINVFISSGILIKLFQFAADYGALKERVKTHGEAIERLQDGPLRIPVKHRE